LRPDNTQPHENVGRRHYHDSGALKTHPAKKHFTEKFRASMTVERWTNAKSAFVAYLTGKGRTAPQIAAELADGTIPETIRGMWRRWGLPMETARGRTYCAVGIWLSKSERSVLGNRALARGISPEEYLRRIAVCAVADDLYDAVTDGRFDQRPERDH